MLALVILVIAGLATRKVLQIKTAIAEGPKHAPPPPAVTTLIAKNQSWQPVLNSVGTLRSVNGVDVSTDLAGIVSEIAFESGATVKKGTLLVKLDTKQEQAQLQAAEAKRELSRLNLARQKDLLTKKATSQSEYDAAAAQARQDDAAVEQAKALVARKTIVAPFDGVLGIRQVNLGQYLNVGNPIAALQSLDPIYVEFQMPQQCLDQIAIGKKIHLKASGASAEQFEGDITAINSKVDEATRNFQVEATVANPDHKLRAGMFAEVQVLLPEQSGVIAIPSSSVNYAPYGDSVYLVTDGKTLDNKPAKIAVQQFVKLGPTRGDQVSVLTGLKEGDEMVTSGVFKVRNNQPVIINNAVQPANEADPKPPET